MKSCTVLEVTLVVATTFLVQVRGQSPITTSASYISSVSSPAPTSSFSSGSSSCLYLSSQGTGICTLNANNEDCDWDGGDCCWCDCDSTSCPEDPDDSGYDCQNPSSSCYEGATPSPTEAGSSPTSEPITFRQVATPMPTFASGNFTEPTPSPTRSESSLTPSGSSDESSGGAPVGAIAGGVAGVLLIGAIVLGFMFKTGRLKTRQRGGPSDPSPATVATRRHGGPSDPSAATVATPASYWGPTATTQYPMVKVSHV
ncbi:unnamed protein product [Scytosiphon promiscuus]